MTETPEAPVDYGTPRYVTAGAFLPILNPRGGKRLDIYGAGKPIPQGAMTDEQIKHWLDKGLIEHTDGKGNVDRYRVVECLSAIIACCADEEGSETWGRPRIAERLRSQGFAFQNKTLGIAIRMWRGDWKSGDPIPER
jgi:hypothetical protein